MPPPAMPAEQQQQHEQQQRTPSKRPRQDAGQAQGQQPGQQTAAATQQQQSSSASEFRDRAVAFLASRLLATQQHCAQAASLELRPSLAKVHGELMALMHSAVALKQNASLLVLGEPGIGKTLVLERVLRDAGATYNTDPSNPTLGAVRLSGALHCDERIAFQEVARQLCSTFNIQFSRSASFDDNLAFFKQVLGELHRAFKCVVFVIDQLDAFVAPAKQTLLYNVLDALTGSQVQAVVLGVSCAYDVQEQMEKRVRSRFSNRKILLPALSTAQDAGGDSTAGVLAQLLLLPSHFEPPARAKQYNSSVHSLLDNPGVKAALQEAVAVGVTPRELAVIALSCLTAWQTARGAQHTGLLPQHLCGAVRGWMAQHDSRVTAMLGLSVLELCMLVAAQRLEDAGTSPFNFQMVLDEFMRVKQMQLGHMWSKAAAWRAFKDVVDQGLVAFTSARPGSKGAMQRFLPAQLRVARGELARALDGHDACPDFVAKWLRGDALPTAMSLG